MSDLKERNELVQLLTDLESTHVWPTTWIINALTREWGLGIPMQMRE